jgi:hypothetical protein
MWCSEVAAGSSQTFRNVVSGDIGDHGRSVKEVPMTDVVNCVEHGRQGIGLVCIHIAKAIESGQQVGFFWGDDSDTARPDAWCWECEQALLSLLPGQTSDAWFHDCEYKVLCAACWDLAKGRLSSSKSD